MGVRDRPGCREEVTLEKHEAERPAALEDVVGLHLLGEQRDAERLQQAHLLRKLCFVMREHVDLDDVRQLDERLEAGVKYEVVESDSITLRPELCERLDHPPIGLPGFEKFDHRALGGQERSEIASHECLPDVHPRPG